MKKETLEMVKVMIFAVVGITLCLIALNAQDTYERNRAIERCGGVQNIQERYTNQGDVYYSCIIEK